MSKHQWSILCRKGIIDKDDNTISLIEAVDEVKLTPLEKLEEKPDSSTLPVIGLEMQLITLWYKADTDRDKEELDFARVKLKDPNGKLLLNQPYNVVIPKDSARARFILRFQHIPFTASGAYVFSVQQKKGTEKNTRWVNVAELFLDIKQDNKGLH